MAQTTTKINACDASVWLDTAAGVLTDISGSSNGVDLSFTREIGELRTFQSKWPVRMGCGKDVEVTLRVIYSTATAEGAHILKNWFFQSTPASRSFHLYLPSKNVGSDHYYGEMALGDMSFNADPTEPGPILIEATLMADGEFSYTVATT